MIRIMIVDDMPIFLEYLRGCIDWGAYGFEICGEAHDGKEAIEKMETLYPDIILTDITMPHVDGLKLAEHVAENYPDVSVILITGNNEFEYARKALKIGVCDYIVKPFEKEELILSLLKLQDNINRALEAKTEKEELETKKREIALRKLILGRSDPEYDYNARLEKVQVNFASSYFLVCTMKFVAESFDKLERINDWESIIISLLKNKIEINGSCQVFRDFENSIVIILNFADEQEMKSYKIYELSDLNKIVKDRLNLGSLIGVSDYCYGLERVRAAYSQALQVVNGKGKEDIGKVFDYKKLEPEGEENYYSWEAVDKLIKGFEQLDEEVVEQTIREELGRMRRHDGSTMNIVMYTGFVSILLTNLIHSGRKVDDIFGKEFQPYRDISLLEQNEDREAAVVALYCKAMQYSKKNANTKSHTVTENAKKYIEAHYMETELSITDISKALLINQTYLRSMFKSEMGLTLSEYITKYRMTVAKRLIYETNEKMSVIAEQVGYSDVSYFSKSFKKYYGVSPKSLGK